MSEDLEREDRHVLRALFDDDVDAYDGARPVAPSGVFDDVMRFGNLRAGSRVVEIGPGTGQATRPLAERGLHVTALELGPRLAERARHNLAQFPRVEVLTTSFDAWACRGPDRHLRRARVLRRLARHLTFG